MKRKIAICLVTLLAVLLATPIQAHALAGGMPSANTISIDNGFFNGSYQLTDQTQPSYYMNRMSGFTGKTITRVWAYLESHYTQQTMTLQIYSAEPMPAELSMPIYEQEVTILATEGESWYSFDLTTPFVVPFDTDTMFIGFRREANPTAVLRFSVDNSSNSGMNSFMGFGPDSNTLASWDLPYNYFIRAEYLEEGNYTISVTPPMHGTIVADKATAAFEDTVSLVITPEAGYRLVAGSLMYNTTPIAGTEFTMPSENVVISGTFELIPFEIAVEVDPNGTLGSDKELANPGDIVTVTFTPKAGFRLVAGSLKYNGIAIVGTTFVMPAASVTITGDFELINQIPNTGDANVNTASSLMVLGLFLVSGSILSKKKKKS